MRSSLGGGGPFVISTYLAVLFFLCFFAFKYLINKINSSMILPPGTGSSFGLKRKDLLTDAKPKKFRKSEQKKQ